MELGALVCRPKNPDCGSCPLADGCRAYRNDRTAGYPKRDPSKAVPHRRLAIAVILKKGKMLVVQRQLEGFLGGLWEFPAVPAGSRSTATASVESKLEAEIGLTVSVERHLTRIRHAYTHFKLTGEVFFVPVCGRAGAAQKRPESPLDIFRHPFRPAPSQGQPQIFRRPEIGPGKIKRAVYSLSLGFLNLGHGGSASVQHLADGPGKFLDGDRFH